MQYPVRAVLFDLDNTLADRESAFAAWSRWFAQTHLRLQHAAAIEAAVTMFVTLDDDGHLPRDALFQMIKARYPDLETEVDPLVIAFRAQLGAYLPPLGEAISTLLTSLDTAGLPWGIVTNGSSQNQRGKLRHLGLEARACCIAISEEIKMRKPDPAIFLWAARRLGLPPGDVLFVGDHPESDVVGAARVGMQTVWVRRSRTWPTHLTDVSPDHTVNSLHDLLFLASQPTHE